MDFADFNVEMRKFNLAFGQKGNEERASLIFEHFIGMKAWQFTKLINHLIQSCPRIPSIAEMLEVSRALFPMQQGPPKSEYYPSMFTEEQTRFLFKLTKALANGTIKDPQAFVEVFNPVLTDIINRKDKVLAEKLFSEISQTYGGL
jgi:hypothetical protein